MWKREAVERYDWPLMALKTEEGATVKKCGESLQKLGKDSP